MDMVGVFAGCLVWSWFAALTPEVREDAIRQLGANTFREREAAAAMIREDVANYAPLLRLAVKDPDPEVSRTAYLLLEGGGLIRIPDAGEDFP